jgi:hypothetical protein
MLLLRRHAPCNKVRLRLPPQAARTEGRQELGRAAWINRAPAVQPHLDELAGSAAGHPRVSVELIGATRTRSGLRVQAELDQAN